MCFVQDVVDIRNLSLVYTLAGGGPSVSSVICLPFVFKGFEVLLC